MTNPDQTNHPEEIDVQIEAVKEADAELAQRVEEIKARLAETLGALLHDQWRNGRKLPNGKFRPREKAFVIDGNHDATWIDAEDVDMSVHEFRRQDIANTDFKDLDPHFTEGLKSFAREYIEELFEKIGLP